MMKYPFIQPGQRETFIFTCICYHCSATLYVLLLWLAGIFHPALFHCSIFLTLQVRSVMENQTLKGWESGSSPSQQLSSAHGSWVIQRLKTEKHPIPIWESNPPTGLIKRISTLLPCGMYLTWGGVQGQCWSPPSQYQGWIMWEDISDLPHLCLVITKFLEPGLVIKSKSTATDIQKCLNWPCVSLSENQFWRLCTSL